MILPLLLLVQSGLSVADPPPVDVIEDVRVVGRRLQKLKLDLAMADGRLIGCRPAVSSGDSFIDVEACEAARACVATRVVGQERLLRCIDSRIRMAVADRDRTPSEK